MSKAPPEHRKGEPAWPRRALASSCSLLVEGSPRTTHWSRTWHLAGGVQPDCAQWPPRGNTGFLAHLPGTRCLLGISSLKKMKCEARISLRAFLEGELESPDPTPICRRIARPIVRAAIVLGWVLFRRSRGTRPGGLIQSFPRNTCPPPCDSRPHFSGQENPGGGRDHAFAGSHGYMTLWEVIQPL